MTKRTESENNAGHLAIRMLAQDLNDQGLELKEVLAVKEVDVPWTEESVKEILIRPIIQTMFGVKSTTKLSKTEFGQAYDVLTRHLAEKLGAQTRPFPSQEGL